VEELCSFLQQREDQELALLKRGVIGELSKYADGRSYEDDVTLLLMEIR
jgi:hypothetical protein